MSADPNRHQPKDASFAIPKYRDLITKLYRPTRPRNARELAELRFYLNSHLWIWRIEVNS